MRKSLTLLAALLMALLIAGCDISDYGIVVNSLEDVEEPPEGMVTLRSALALAEDGKPIVFAPEPRRWHHRAVHCRRRGYGAQRRSYGHEG